jgi:pimeloyl-ACP methyl ester carboxylesterase
VTVDTLIPSTDGVRVAVHDFGGPEDPTSTLLLFSHATGFHGLAWEPVATRLTDRYRCLAIDYRGHGLSETPADTGFGWDGMGDDTVAVLESALVGTRRAVHGIGHSMGGAALVLAAARRPGAFHSLWLYEPIIVEPGVLPPAGSPNPMADAAARRRSSFASYDEALAHYAAKPPLDQLHRDALRAYVWGGFAQGPEGRVSLRCAPTVEASVFRGAGGVGVWDASAKLDLPVAVVAGRSQPMSPVVYVPQALTQLSGGTLVERRDLGHFGPLEDPAGTARDIAAWVDACA